MSDSLDFIFERANSALLTRDFEYAEHLITGILKRQPPVAPAEKEKAEKLLARIYVDADDFQRALSAYIHLHEQNPHDVDVMNTLGKIYRHLGRYTEALDILEKSKQIGGLTDEVLYNLAKTYKRIPNYEKAAEYFSLAIEIKPDHAHAYDRLGNLYVLTGETDKAIEIYKKGLRADSNHPFLNFHLAVLLKQEKRYEEAIIYYQSALRTNPSWAKALHDIAQTYVQLGKLDNAIHTYKSLFRISGKSSALYTELGAIFEQKQLDHDAEQYYREALLLNSAYVPAVLSLAALLARQKNYEIALPFLLTAESDPVNRDNHQLRLKAIELCIYVKDYAKAFDLIKRIDKQHQDEIESLKLRAQLAALTGETEQAEDLFKQILQQMPSAIDVRRELAKHYLTAHKYAEARQQLKMFLTHQPNNIEARLDLGKAEELLGNLKDAYKEYQTVLTQDKDSIEARAALTRLLQKRGHTIEALKTADELLNIQSTSEQENHIQGLVDTLDLYEQAAGNYMNDPQFKKNLDLLKKEDAVYIPASELEQPDLNYEPIPILEEDYLDLSASETPLDLSLEENEEDIPLHEDREEYALDEDFFDDAVELKTGVFSSNEGMEISSLEKETADIPLYTQEREVQLSAPVAQSQQQPETADILPHLPENRLGLAGCRQESEVPPSILLPYTAMPQPPRAEGQEPAYSAAAVPHSEEPSPSEKTAIHAAASPFSAELTSAQQSIEKPSAMVPVYQYSVSHTEAENTHEESFDPDILSQILEKPRKNITAAEDNKDIQDRLENYKTYGTALQFLHDIVAELNERFDAKEYSSVVQLLADRIADNLAGKLPLTEHREQGANTPIQDKTPYQETVSETSPAISGEEWESQPYPDDNEYDPSYDFIPHFLSDFDEVSDNTVMPLEYPAGDDDEHTVSQQEDGDKDTILDEEQKNILWCHAERKLKDSAFFEEYLRSADTEQLAGLFMYLRDLLAFLPEDKLTDFLTSPERMKAFYIISRLSGELGLGERAALMKHTAQFVSSIPEEAIGPKNMCALFAYLQELANELPDKGISERCKKELEYFITQLSSCE